ncbi:MAG: hypothetical protein JWQ07_458 [Ramlibacter sp.]|nr:hypothetical protein [Ramlibacter sp.]
MTRIFIHAGAPRTGTTILQKAVFPNLRNVHYLGKNADNSFIPGEFKPHQMIMDASKRYHAGDPQAMGSLRMVMPSLIMLLKAYSQDPATDGSKARMNIARLAARCLEATANALGDKPVLYSDESLVESVSGLVANPRRGDDVPLEQWHAMGFLESVSLSIVLRDPLGFLRASYYKAMEFRHRRAVEPLSFDEYIVTQMEIYERKPSASRIFLCMHETVRRHFQALCPGAVVTHYRDLVESAHVVDSLLGLKTGEIPASLRVLPRENTSWRDPGVNASILGANGVPAKLTIEQYAGTFPETLQRHGLDALFAKEADGASPAQAKPVNEEPT